MPFIDLRYWLMIVSATTVGETAGDLISMTFGAGYGLGSVILVTLFIAVVAASIGLPRYRAVIYWIAIMLAGTTGTTLSDFLTRTVSLGYDAGVVVLACVLAMVLLSWYGETPDLGVGELDTTTQGYYWATLLISSTLGTAFGDAISDTGRLGAVGGTILLGTVLGAIAMATRLSRWPRAALYWSAIIVTHPIGATLGDALTKVEGMNLGNLPATIILLAAFAGLSLLGPRSGVPQT